MHARKLTPILNVSNIAESFLWFEKLGWQKGWDWGEPPTFGGVCSGECEIFLCEGGQGGRGRGGVKMTFGPDGDTTADKGMDIDLGGRRRRRPSAVRRAGSRRRLAADRHAVGRPRDACAIPTATSSGRGLEDED